MVALGATVAVQAGAGVKSGILDADYTAAGAAVAADPVNDADIVLQVRRPEGPELSRLKKGAVVIGMILISAAVALRQSALDHLLRDFWGALTRPE